MMRKWLTTLGFLSIATLGFALNQVRQEIRAERAATVFNATGRGVLVAILDRGLDYTHPDFRNADGTTRIAAIFDLLDDTGKSAAGNTYGVGTIYSRAQIDAALASGVLLATRDAVGHGTSTTGLAAGNGARSAGLYRGIAPESTLLIIKVTSDGAPAHDGEAAEAAFYNPDRVLTAIDYARAKAAELHMPCVMLLNLGSQSGPTDGSSKLARKIDSVVGPGIPGLIFVTGTGDEGGQPNRAGAVVAAGETKRLQFTKGATGNLRLELWYPDSDRFDVMITTPSGDSPIYASPAANTNSDVRTVANQYTYYHYGSAVDPYESTSPKRSMLIDFPGATGNYAISLIGKTVSNGRFDATLNPSFASAASRVNIFTTFVAPGSIWDGATAFNNIAPNSYVLRDKWTDIDGIARTFTGQGLPGEIWRGSSIGPTFDGRRGVDVSAPGDEAISTYGPRTNWATFRFNVIQGSGGYYGIAGAVSAAAPITTGTIALMLQMNPQLDAPTVKRILQQTARTDAFTGVTPNNTWGYGKLDAYAAVARTVIESAPATSRGALVNLSIRTDLVSATDSFTMGYVVGGAGTSGSKPVLVRAAGPSLAQFLSGFLKDPKLETYSGSIKTGENDNWGGTAQLTAGFAAVGAFPFSANNSLDAAVLGNIPSGSGTVIVRASDGGTGTVIAEVYDSTPSGAVTPTTPRLVNVSILKHLRDGLTVGFVIRGAAPRTVLIRAVGPTLGDPPFGVGGVVANPQLTLFTDSGSVVSTNDNWGGGSVLTEAFAQVGAFALPAASRDAVILETLAPGAYTVTASGVGGTSGVGIVEVYEMPE